ncbi:MAG: hypothetical protein WBM08_04030 [Prochlorococcaceae cyanobacterium]
MLTEMGAASTVDPAESVLFVKHKGLGEGGIGLVPALLVVLGLPIEMAGEHLHELGEGVLAEVIEQLLDHHLPALALEHHPVGPLDGDRCPATSAGCCR